jgi:multidrug efflux pump
MLLHIDFSIMSLIGDILLIGIMKKNAIMVIDLLLWPNGRSVSLLEMPFNRACQLRFRPIMMTIAAALFGALPLAIGMGELRQPLGIGGLIVNQLFTLYTTPVVCLYFDRVSLWLSNLPSGAPLHYPSCRTNDQPVKDGVRCTGWPKLTSIHNRRRRARDANSGSHPPSRST